jgi:hypothetical protein
MYGLDLEVLDMFFGNNPLLTLVKAFAKYFDIHFVKTEI